jgi:PAS domain S-box-containing protein
MADELNEEQTLRSAALQNARSIFLARQKAERELIQTRDALEQKSKELAEQHTWFRVTLASIGDAVVATDTRLKVTFLNPVAEALTGWKFSEAVGEPLDRIFVILNEDTRLPVANPVAEVLQTGTIVGLANHTVLVARDGREIPIEDSAAPIRDASGGTIGAVMVFHDVAERRQAERALRQSEARLALALEAGRMGAWEWIIPADRVTWSPTFDSIHGRPVGAHENSIADFTRDIHPDDRERVLERLSTSIAQRLDYHVEYRIVKPDGAVSWMEARGKLHLDEQGRPERLAGVCMDVTDRKRVEEIHSRLAAVVEFSGDAIITKTLDGTITTWNRAAERIFGYSEGEMLGKPVTLLIPADRADEELNIISRVKRGQVVPPYETVRIRKDGKLLNISLTVSPIKDASGVIIGASKIARDITQRKQSEAERARLTGILESSLNEIYIFDAVNLRYEYVNRGALRNLGYSMEEMRSMTPLDLKPEFQEPEYRRLVEPLLEGDREKLLFRCTHRRRDGTCYPVEVHLQAVKQYSDSVFLAVVLDITERKKVEEDRERLLVLEQAARAKAEKAETRARFLAETSASLASTLDYEATLRNVAQAAVPEIADWCAVHVLEPNDAIRAVAVTHADEARKPLAEQIRQLYPVLLDSRSGVSEVLRSGRPRFHPVVSDAFLMSLARDSKDLALLRSLGLRSMIIVPLKTSQRTLGAITFATAESGRRFTEADLPFAEDLASRAATAAENARLYQELHHANAAKDHFLAVLSHELRTPLNPVLMTVSDLEHDDALAPDLRAQLTVVRRNVELEARLIDDLLDSTRIANGKLQLQRTVVDATELIRRAVAIAARDARTKGVQVDVTTTSEPCPVDADPARLQQVIWNVVKNAVKFTPPGGCVRLCSQIEPPGQLQVIIEDNGIGIEPANLETIFNAFEQGAAGMNHNFGGLGLGLTISKALVNLHGGSLVAQSEGLGHGARFILTLPLAAQLPALAEETNFPVAVPFRLRLLVVEDHATTSHVMVRLLSKRGYEVTAASNIQEALALLGKHEFDLLVSDVGLPDGNGRELMEKVRGRFDLPGIALSGYGTEADVAQSSAAGFSVHLTKPIDIERLDREIQALAQRSSNPNIPEPHGS